MSGSRQISQILPSIFCSSEPGRGYDGRSETAAWTPLQCRSRPLADRVRILVRMKLWTWHKPDFSLVAGHVDHSKSEYFQTVKGIPEAYTSGHSSRDQSAHLVLHRA